VPSDQNGMQVETLAALLPRQPKLIYVAPNFQNPQGTTLSGPRREFLVQWIRNNQTPVVEDNPYGELRYSGEALPNLLGLEGQNPDGSLIIYTGTFSKVLMPGLRVGWVIAPREVIDKLVQTKQSADLHTSTLTQHIALELVKDGFIDEFLPVIRKTYRERRDLMLESLDHDFSQVATWTRPEGGMFLLMTLPGKINAAELLPRAIEHGVAYVPGEEFHLNEGGKNTMRLNFSNANPARIQEGMKRLARVLSDA
jgi:2-aminoadipate transaminase